MIGIAERGDANCSSLQILDRLNLAGGPGSGDNGEQREAPRDREAADVRADIGIGLDGNIQRGGSVVDGAADQRLHRGVAAAGIDELHIKPMILEVTCRSRDLVRNAAQKLTAIGQLDLLALSLGLGGSRRRNDACDQRSPLEQRTPGHLGIGYSSGGFIAAAHGSLQTVPPGAICLVSPIRSRGSASHLDAASAYVASLCSSQRSSPGPSRPDRLVLARPLDRGLCEDMPPANLLSNA